MLLKTLIFSVIFNTSALAETTTTYKGSDQNGDACELEVVLYDNGNSQVTADYKGRMSMFFVDPTEESSQACNTPMMTETDTELKYRHLEWMTEGFVSELTVQYGGEDSSTVSSFKIEAGKSSLFRWRACRNFNKKKFTVVQCNITSN